MCRGWCLGCAQPGRAESPPHRSKWQGSGGLTRRQSKQGDWWGYVSYIVHASVTGWTEFVRQAGGSPLRARHVQAQQLNTTHLWRAR